MKAGRLFIAAALMYFLPGLVLADDLPQYKVHVMTDKLLVPTDTILLRNDISGVMVFDNGMSRFRMVKKGKTEENNIEILSGLLPGDEVILGDLQALRDGTRISIQK